MTFLVSSYGQTFELPTFINNKKNKVLFRQKDNQLVFYSLIENKVISKYNFPKNTFSIHCEFSKNDNQFFVLYKFIDSNFKKNKWKPQKYYKKFTDFDGRLGWKEEKSVTLSVLKVYDCKNGSFLYSLKDTGFFYEDLSKKTFGRLVGKIKLPKYFESANYVINSNSLVSTISVKPYKESPHHLSEGQSSWLNYYDIWDLKIGKKIISNLSEQDTIFNKVFKISDFRIELLTNEKVNNSNILSNSLKTESLFWVSKDNNLQSRFLNDSTFAITNLHTQKVIFKKKFGKNSYLDFRNCSFTEDSKKFLFLNEQGTELYFIYDIEKSKLIFSDNLK